MNNETRTTLTFFAAGILVTIMVFSANMQIGDIVSFLYAEIFKF